MTWSVNEHEYVQFNLLIKLVLQDTLIIFEILSQDRQ
jgi:hypothetical protein